ncbi:MAG: 2-oxoacid:acceptor oxidoreductase family protein, partial [Gammaproteobacteria bacterium]|nr:2-oxoacid:acceptor oxidoreductase family protein [Gammaproteobacteria bacterium]
TYGGARRGTPVSSFIRVDDRPIRLRCDIEHPDAILCFDFSLLTAGLLDRAANDTLIVVNSGRSAGDRGGTDGFRILPVDGIAISQRHGLGRIVNSSLLGAFICALQAPSIDVMKQIIAEAAPTRKAENVSACLEAYDRTKRLLEEGLVCQ